MTIGGENFGGSGRIELLDRVADSGSISQAARVMKMSYKAAWDAIQHMGNLAGEPLVQRIKGGKGGGKSWLTKRGEKLVEDFRALEKEHREYVDALSRLVDSSSSNQQFNQGKQGNAENPAPCSQAEYKKPEVQNCLSISESFLPAHWREQVLLPSLGHSCIDLDGIEARFIGYDSNHRPCFTRYQKRPLKNSGTEYAAGNVLGRSIETHAWRLKNDQWLVLRVESNNQFLPEARYEFCSEMP